MRYSEIKNLKQINEMARTKADAKDDIKRLRDQINDHLLKILCDKNCDQYFNSWKKELSTWLRKIARIKLKSTNKPPTADFIFEYLFNSEFGGDEEEVISFKLDDLVGDEKLVEKQSINITKIANILKLFHLTFAKHCSEGTTVEQIDILLESLRQIDVA